MIKLIFQPQANETKLIEAVKEYKKIWNEYGARIVQVMEKISGLKFAEKEIKVMIWEGTSANELDHIKLRANYNLKTKIAVLIHELGHRLLFWLNKLEELNPHQVLYLILYDVWEELYGKNFADDKVLFEKNIINPITGNFKYKNNWEWALSMRKEERIEKFQELIKKHISIIKNTNKITT